MATVTVSNKGQVVIPVELRRRFGITPGCQLEFVEEGASLRVFIRRRAPETRIGEGYGMLVYRGESRRLSEFDVADAIVEHLVGLPHVTVEDWTAVLDACEHAKRGLDFADALHVARSGHRDRFVTFDDRKFARGAERLGASPCVVVPSDGAGGD